MIALVLLACGAGEPTGVDVALPSGTGAARLNVTVAPAPDAAWAAFLDKLFAHLDRDGDGKLSRAEAGRAFALPLPGGREAKPDFAATDTNGDGTVSAEEFRAFYRRAGFAPVAGATRAPDAEAARLSAALARHLDRDGDGTISAEEWKAAPALVRRLDENEDEVIDARELLANAPDGAPAATTGASVTAARANPAARLLLDLGAKPAARLEADAPGFKAGTGAHTFDVPSGRLRVALGAPSGATGFRSAREFYLAQFAEALGTKPALTAAEIESDVALAAVAGMVPFADRDGDGKLTAAELRAFLELIEAGLSCQVTVALEDRGPNLFDLLDTDADGRLDASELRRASSFAALKLSAVPRELRLSVARGSTARAFGPVPVPAPKAAPAQPAAKSAAGPAWFRALDRNGDGFVSAAEFRGTPEAFAKLDADGDGRISAAEAEAAGR